jgi:serine/threonine protein phosphatase PrpC
MPETDALKLRTAARSDPGRDPSKQINEDAFRVFENTEGLLVVVCDGMGGHVGGRLASNTAVNQIELAWRSRSPNAEPRRLLEESIQKAAAEVYSLGGSSAAEERPGSTCVAAWLSRQGLYVAHVGDSRAYRYRSGTLYPLTVDHTVVEAWIAAGQLTREQAKGHPDAHRITRALGILPNVDVEHRPVEELRAQDRLLFCSDGLTDLVSEQELRQWLGSPHDLEVVADNLVGLANQRGGHDNITVVLVEVLEATPPADTVTAGPVDVTSTSTNHLDVNALAAGTIIAGTVVDSPVTYPRTVPLEATHRRTVLMADAPSPPTALPVTQAAKALPRQEKTVLLGAPEVTPEPPPPRFGDSYCPPPVNNPQYRARRQLWLVIGIGIALSLLAILVRLLRHRSG